MAKMSQSPFSSGEVFHPFTPLLAEVDHKPVMKWQRCLNPLLVAGKYSTVDKAVSAVEETTGKVSQSPFSSGEVFHVKCISLLKLLLLY